MKFVPNLNSKEFYIFENIMPHYSCRYLIYPNTVHTNNNIAIVICNSVHLMVQCSPYTSESVHVYDAHIQWCHDGFITDAIGRSSDNAAGIVTDWIMYSETKLARVAAPVYDNIYKDMTWLFSKLHVRNILD
jgi:transcription elongation factor Elf1